MNSDFHPGSNRRQNGLALLAVLWLVAALTVMVGSLQHVVRGEIQVASQTGRSVIGSGVADAAIRLKLQELALDKNKAVKTIERRTVTVFGNSVDVEVIPLNGFIDLNSAPISLLADAFHFVGGVPKEAAQKLATAAADMRDEKGSDGVPVGFHAVEDLMRIGTLDYKVYAKMKGVFVADIVGTGLVNPLAANASTLQILAKGDQSLAHQLLESLRSSPDSMDVTTLTANHIEIVGTSYLAIQATVTLREDLNLRRTWRVDTSAVAYGLPWRMLNVEQRIIADGDLLK